MLKKGRMYKSVYTNDIFLVASDPVFLPPSSYEVILKFTNNDRPEFRHTYTADRVFTYITLVNRIKLLRKYRT